MSSELCFRLINPNTRRMKTVTEGDSRRDEWAGTACGACGKGNGWNKARVWGPRDGSGRLGGGKDESCHRLPPLCWAVARPCWFRLY